MLSQAPSLFAEGTSKRPKERNNRGTNTHMRQPKPVIRPQFKPDLPIALGRHHLYAFGFPLLVRQPTSNCERILQQCHHKFWFGEIVAALVILFSFESGLSQGTFRLMKLSKFLDFLLPGKINQQFVECMSEQDDLKALWKLGHVFFDHFSRRSPVRKIKIQRQQC